MKKIYLLAGIMAIITAIAVYSFASSVSTGGSQKVPNVIVVVAKADIPENTVITDSMLTTVTIPSTSVSGNMAQKTQDVVGKISPYPIGMNEYVYSTKLYKLGETTADKGLSYTLEKGMRAVTIRVDDTSAVGFFIKQGDYVDILVLKTIDNAPTTQMLLEKVKVLCTGDKGTVEGSQYATLTLSVTPVEAERIIHNYTNAKIVCMLRPTGDDQIVNPPGVK